MSPELIDIQITVGISNDIDQLKKVDSGKPRLEQARQLRQDRIKSLTTHFNIEQYAISNNAYQVNIDTTLNKLDAISMFPGVTHVIIRQISPGVKRRLRQANELWCLQLHFAIQIEKRTNGLISIEEQFVLLKATSQEQARKRIQSYVKEYESPYLNSDGFWVRWKCEAIVDVYSVVLSKFLRIEATKAIEVFSSFKRRRMTTDDYWDGQW